MDWTNEVYVRMYTRETDDDLALSWQGMALWRAMLARFDRAGFIATKRGARGLAAVVRIPADVVTAALPELLVDGRVIEVSDSPAGPGFFAPNFFEAQDAVKTDRQRQREFRMKRSAQTLVGAVTKSDIAVTESGETVTLGHARSHGVTLSLAERSVTELSESPARAPARSSQQGPEYTPTLEASGAAISAPIAQGDVAPDGSAAARTAPAAPPPSIGWLQLQTELWRAGAARYQELHAAGVDRSAREGAWAGLPDKLIGARLRDLREERGFSLEEARRFFLDALDTAEAKARDAETLQYLVPARFLDAESFKISGTTTPDQVRRSSAARAGPARGSRPEPPLRKINPL